MHEVRITVHPGLASDIAKLALEVGIDRVTVCPAYVWGPNSDAEIVSVETSTPRAKAFLDRLMSSGAVDLAKSSVTTREIRAILGSRSAQEVTYPAVQPLLEVFEDLWQLNHVTPSYVVRALVAELLLGYGMLRGDVISLVVAALFLPFIAQILALGFGLWASDWRLARQGAIALAVSMAISVLAGFFMALALGGPDRFDGFKSPVVSLVMSLAIGAAAGLSSADDAGRRYLIGVAAAAQSGVFAVWIGIALVLGFPETPTTVARIATLLINIVTIGIAASVAYALVGLRRESVRRLFYHGSPKGRP
jgi:hypothetical protein